MNTQRTPYVVDRRIADKATDESIRELRKAVVEPADSPIVAGRFVTVEFDGTNPVAVQHGLGRKAQGYIPTRMSASANIFDGSGTAPNRADIIWLEANNPCTVILWIF